MSYRGGYGMSMTKLSIVAAFLFGSAYLVDDASARGGGGGHGGGRASSHGSSHSSGGRASAPHTSNRGAHAPGTGSNASSTAVRSYTRKDGKHVDAHKRSAADKRFQNNWSTKGNQNPSNGKEGSRVSPPRR